MTPFFRHSAGFGKRIEYGIIGRILNENMDLYVRVTSEEFIRKTVQNKNGKSVTQRGIGCDDTRTDRQTGERAEYVKGRYKRYVATDFSRLANPTAIPPSEA